jgi:benzodiazapine receptor
MNSYKTRPGVALLLQVAVALAWVTVVSLIGQRLTDLGPWYQGLRQPPWKPPDWAFGVIWTSVFALIVASGVMVWRRCQTRITRVWLLALWGLNSILHMLWSLLFFTLKRPDWSMLEIPFLWISIAAIMLFSWRLSRIASLLLAPYIVWVTIAALLNLANVQLNGPF